MNLCQSTESIVVDPVASLLLSSYDQSFMHSMRTECQRYNNIYYKIESMWQISFTYIAQIAICHSTFKILENNISLRNNVTHHVSSGSQ